MYRMTCYDDCDGCCAPEYHSTNSWCNSSYVPWILSPLLITISVICTVFGAFGILYGNNSNYGYTVLFVMGIVLDFGIILSALFYCIGCYSAAFCRPVLPIHHVNRLVR